MSSLNAGTGIGLCLPQLGPHVDADVIVDFARRAESLGYSGLWVQDHFMYPLAPKRGYGGPGVLPPEQYQTVYAPTETLAFVAAATSTVRLGTSILVAGNHWPVPLAQRLATIDQLSKGRLVAGFGIGWSQDEHEAVGVDIETRGRRMDDFIPAMLACWADDPVSHHGPFFDVPPSIVRPKPYRGSRPMLMSGMFSEEGMRRTAKWFDAWNPAFMKVPVVQGLVDTMNSERGDGLAPLQVFYRSFIQPPLGRPRVKDGDLGSIIADATAAAEAGFTEVILEHNFWDEIGSAADWLSIPERFAPVLEAVNNR